MYNEIIFIIPTISIQDIIIIFIFTEMSDTTGLKYQPFSGYQYCFTKIGDEKKNNTHFQL